ncbi:MAG TPA: PepSY-associated TM helix domain-containing protein [Cellvibrio sp.]|nr:PepSY-associated TM helix domain-containing protein [Cellvibrio sp.]
MRGPLLKIYKTLHTWVGLIAGMALFIAFYAGALTMFKEPLSRWATPEQWGAQHWPSENQLPDLIKQLITTQPDAAKSFTLHLQQQENTPAAFTWRQGRESTLTWYANLSGDNQLEIHSYEPSAMADLIDRLHQTAGIPGDGHHAVGVYVMGVISVLYILAIVSGLIILLPNLLKDFFSLRESKSPKRFWMDAHNLVGITSLPFHIVIGLTVIVFAFHDQIYDGLGKMAYGDRPLFARPADAPTPSQYTLEQLLPPDQLVAKVKNIAPGFIPRELMYNGVLSARASVRIAGEDPEHMLRGANRGFVSLDPYTGEITDKDYLPGHESGWVNIVITFFALHFGSYGGDPIRWIYFFLGLGGAFVFYTGNLLWVESRRRRQRPHGETVQQARNTRFMAAATVGVCWGCIAGISSAMVAGKWLYPVGTPVNDWYIWVYYSVFLASVAWAFFRGAGRAAVELLWLCSLSTLAIPITALLALLIPNSPAWFHTSADLLLVELTALVAAGIFAHMAIKTRRRLENAAPDSVWGETGYTKKVNPEKGFSANPESPAVT